MLDKDELEKIAEMIPARTKYAVIASWADADETADTWDDLEHVHYCATPAARWRPTVTAALWRTSWSRRGLMRRPTHENAG